MGDVTEIWRARGLKRGLSRHWVRFGEAILLAGGPSDPGGVLSIFRSAADGRLVASITEARGQRIEEIGRSGQLVIDTEAVRVVVAVRAVEAMRALVEFGVPHGGRIEIVLQAFRTTMEGARTQAGSTRPQGGGKRAG